MIVLKFGGTSVATAESRRAVAELIRKQKEKGPVVVVVSAVDGATELLDEASRAAALGNHRAVDRLREEIRKRNAGSDPALLAELSQVLEGLLALGELTARSRDLVLSFGERLAAPLVAAAAGADAVPLDGKAAGVVTDDHFGEASPLREVTRYEVRRKLKPMLEKGKTPVVTGFLGGTQHGTVTTLGRGGSDFSATLIGAALDADEVWLCSDIDGLRAADPRIVMDAAPLPEISFGEALEMVQFGAKGIHPRALEPAAEQKIPVRIVNTFRPDGAATVIGAKAPATPGSVRSLHLVSGVSWLTVAGASMVGRRGTASRLFAAIAEAGGNVRMISQSVSESGISVAIGRKELDAVRSSLQGSLVRTGIVRRVVVEENAAIVAVVGEAMRGTPGVSARVFGAVARAGINVIGIAQGSSELSISFVVDGARGADAIRALHAELLADGTAAPPPSAPRKRSAAPRRR